MLVSNGGRACGARGGATLVAVGYMYTCAILADGGVKCWGRNAHGQLGVGGTNDQLTPQSVPLGAGERE